mmetsp:Transcript_43102/g.31481  ORF Transcript_43102/g.31481 Transcript_43102/m.31481 type:complete len:353 (-) Transcript_43102:64-1122(-)
MASKNRGNKKSQKTPAPVAPEDPTVEGRLIDVQLWKTVSKGKVTNSSVELGDAAPEGDKVAEPPRKPSKQIQIPRSQLGKLIGPKGSTIKKFEEHFSVQISQPAAEPGATETTSVKVNIEGDDREQVQSAVAAIKQFFITGIAPWSEHQLITESVEVPKRCVREINGDQGKVKIQIGRNTRTQIVLPIVQENDLNGTTSIKISGAKHEDVAKAKEIIEEIVLFHCHPVTHPELTYMQMDVPQKYHGRILGSRGSHTQRLELEFKVRIYLPSEVQPNLVVVGESEDSVARALDAIEDIMDDTDKQEVIKAEAEAAKAAKKAAKEEARAKAKAAAEASAEITEADEETGSDEAK